jgi:hypothetical protein
MVLVMPGKAGQGWLSHAVFLYCIMGDDVSDDEPGAPDGLRIPIDTDAAAARIAD